MSTHDNFLTSDVSKYLNLTTRDNTKKVSAAHGASKKRVSTSSWSRGNASSEKQKSGATNTSIRTVSRPVSISSAAAGLFRTRRDGGRGRGEGG